MVSLTIFGFIIAAISIAILVLYFKSEYDKVEYLDETIVDIIPSQYTNGFSLGTLVDRDIGVERDGIYFQPKDVAFMKRLKRKIGIKIKPHLFYAQHSRIIPWKISGERERLLILPPNAEDLPKELLRTSFGMAIAKYMEDQDAKDTILDIQRQRIDLEDELLKKTAGGDRTREYLVLDKQLNKDLSKKILTGVSKDEKKSFPFPGTSSSSN